MNNVMNVEAKGSREIYSVNENALAIAFLQGDETAFDDLVHLCQGRVYAVAYRITLNREDALDVSQDALIKAHDKIKMWRPTGGFVPWLLRLTTNQAIDHIRKRKRHQHESFDDVLSTGVEQVASKSISMDTERSVHAREIEQRIRDCLVILSPAQRTAFMLRHFEGLSLAEIAPVIGCTVGSVKVHLFRALRKLRKELGDLYGIAD